MDNHIQDSELSTRLEGLTGIAHLGEDRQLKIWDRGFNELSLHIGVSEYELANLLILSRESGEKRLTLRAPGGGLVRLGHRWIDVEDGTRVEILSDRGPTDDVSVPSLKTKVQELECRNRDLEAFGLSISHDLRSPLRAVRGYATRVREGLESAEPELLANWLDRIQNNLDRADSLMDALMDLTRAIQRPLKRTQIDVSCMAKSVASGIAEREPDRKFKFKIDEQMTASADPALFRLLLENLMSNSAKFTRHQAVASIAVVSPNSDVYAVIDNGIGFSPADAPKLFEPFARLHEQAVYEGNGLGLHIARRIVERHRGMLWASGAPDEGARFGFMLAPVRLEYAAS